MLGAVAMWQGPEQSVQDKDPTLLTRSAGVLLGLLPT